MGRLISGLKTCVRCRQEKPIEQFYRIRSASDGHQSWCKACATQYARDRRPPKQRQPVPTGFARCSGCKTVKSIDEFPRNRANRNGHGRYCRSCQHLRARVYEKTEKNRKRKRCYQKGYARRPEIAHKMKIRQLAQLAALFGVITKGLCRCGSATVEAHHADYSRPLDVIWLCRECHRIEHLRIKQQEKA